MTPDEIEDDEHVMQASVKVYLTLQDGEWVIDPVTLQPGSLDGSAYCSEDCDEHQADDYCPELEGVDGFPTADELADMLAQVGGRGWMVLVEYEDAEPDRLFRNSRKWAEKAAQWAIEEAFTEDEDGTMVTNVEAITVFGPGVINTVWSRTPPEVKS